MYNEFGRIQHFKNIETKDDLLYVLNISSKKYNYLIYQNPNNSDYVIKLANLYVKKYDYLNARKVIKAYLKKHPSEKNKFSNYGILSL